MKLHLTTAQNQNLITAYGDGFIAVNQQRYNSNIIVMPDKLIADWIIGGFSDLDVGHFEQIAHLKPEVVLLGTGEKHQFLHPKMTQALSDIHISVEYMSTAAACRTYNILMAEGRQVAAALLV